MPWECPQLGGFDSLEGNGFVVLGASFGEGEKKGG